MGLAGWVWYINESHQSQAGLTWYTSVFIVGTKSKLNKKLNVTLH